MTSFFKYSKEVENAINNNLPIVALESTIITHGMPYPSNYETAKNVENIIRKEGAIPATIVIKNGFIHIGLNDDELHELSKEKDVYKSSKSDISYVLTKKLTGSTTVAATIFLAELAKIAVFVTGGIGGVHRDYEKHLDVSNDLEQLSETKITVISAGAKAILDLEKTIEYIETKGITLIGFQTNYFPAFYSSQSNIKINMRLDTVEEVANLIKTHNKLNNKSSILICNPIKKEDEIPFDEMEKYIKDAQNIMNERKIKGKDVTPFLLKEIVEKTKGKSLISNISLIYNNALLGAKIAIKIKED